MNNKPFSNRNNHKNFTKFRVAFFLISCLLLVGGLLAILPKTSKVVAAQEEVVWQCSASGANYHYVVDQLVKKERASFDLAVYQVDKSRPLDKDYFWSAQKDYLETVTLTASQDTNTALKATGRNSNRMIEVTALGRTVAFNVKDSIEEATALGQCDRFWEMASSQTRQKIRECLAVVARQYGGNIAEVKRHECLFIDQ